MNTLELRKQFPILSTSVKGKPLIYFDTAASAQKPFACIQAIENYYKTSHANVHRGVHYLSQKATDMYEQARKTVADFIKAPSPESIVFVRGTTEAINLIAHGFSRSVLKPGDEIIISAMEHHANIVPWQMACEYTGAILKIAPINEKGELLLNELYTLFSEKTKLLSLTYISNAIGTINPIKEIIARAKQHNIPVLIDGAQAVPHLPVDVSDLDCDFFAFSGHKAFGPTGIGALYAKSSWLDKLPPYQGGGDMIIDVTFEKSTYAKAPAKFEAGTPHIAGAIGLAATLNFLTDIGMENIFQYEQTLLTYATEQFAQLPHYNIIGTAQDKASVISFVHEWIHPHDIGTILDDAGIAIRTGHHCAMPLMDVLHVPATARASLTFYNTPEEIDQLILGLKQVERIFE